MSHGLFSYPAGVGAEVIGRLQFPQPLVEFEPRSFPEEAGILRLQRAAQVINAASADVDAALSNVERLVARHPWIVAGLVVGGLFWACSASNDYK